MRQLIYPLLAAACLSAASCSSFHTTSRDSSWREIQVGLCEDYPEETRTLAQAKRDLVFARESGARVLRVALGWDAIEPERGRWDWTFWDEFVETARAEGVVLIPYVCYTPRWAARDNGEDFWRSPPRDVNDFGHFVEALVRHYRGHIHSWELWNEPDNPSYWLGTRREFAALVQAGSEAVRRADPTCTVVLGGIATNWDFLEALFRDDGIAPAVDVVNFHSYLETWHHDPIEHLGADIRRVAEIVRTYGEHEPLWLAEIGYSSVGPRAHTSDYYHPTFTDEHTNAAQANALLRMIVLAGCSEQISTTAWYRIHDLPTNEAVIGDDNNRHLGVLTSEGHPKAAAESFRTIAALFGRPFRAVPAEGFPGSAGLSYEVRVVQPHGGRPVLFAWNSMPGSAPLNIASAPDVREQTVKVRLPEVRERLRISPKNEAGRRAYASYQRKNSGTEITLVLRGSDVVILEL